MNCIKNEQSIPRIVSLSGGQPDLAPEYQLWFLKARENLGLENEVFIWADDNLSTDFIWRFLDSAELEYIVNKKNYARVGCLKGFDNDSCNFNTGVMRENLLDDQIYILKRLVSIGFEQYAYITLTSIDTENVYDKISYLFDKIQTLICEKFLLRIIPLEIFKYNVNCSRIVKEALCNQYKVVDCWKKLLTERFNSKELSDNYIIF